MKLKVALVLPLLGISLISGCHLSIPLNLYPVQGPAAAMTPPQVFNSTIIFNGTPYSNSGKVSLVLANGESFQGQYTTATADSVNAKTPGTPASYPPQPNLSFAWDAIYGQGSFVAQILGKQVQHVLLTGNQGTVLQTEFVYPRGVAVDNKGNVYKMVWSR